MVLLSPSLKMDACALPVVHEQYQSPDVVLLFFGLRIATRAGPCGLCFSGPIPNLWSRYAEDYLEVMHRELLVACAADGQLLSSDDLAPCPLLRARRIARSLERSMLHC